MVQFVRFTLDDGSEVLFESAENDLVTLHRGGPPEVRDGGKLTARLKGVAEAAEEVAGSLRARLVPDEVSLEFGLKVSGGVNWFFAKAQGEGTIKVTVKWAANSASAAPPGIGQDPGKG
jgi:Trypsin-co-occurring domain 1